MGTAHWQRLGATIRKKRKDAGLTQEELAERAGISVRTLVSFENGLRRPRSATYRLVSDALGLTDVDTEEVSGKLANPLAHAASTQARSCTGEHHFWQVPAAPGPLFGREEQLEELLQFVCGDARRLVTITGMGGVGKTRIALEVALRSRAAFADGVVFISLESVCDHTLVAHVIARALSVQETSESPPEALVGALDDKHLLLVLDNFEQVASAATLIASLHAHCPALHVLVTSRAPLLLNAEQEYPLSPLSVPPRDGAQEELAHVASVELFVHRTQCVLPRFRLTEANAPTVAAICRRLDGLPLAIELAARRLKIFSLDALLERLDHRLDVLTSDTRDARGGQHTLRQTIAWSYELLSPEQRAIFRRFAVFAGGATAQAIEAICGNQGCDGPDLYTTLTALVDHHLVLREDVANEESEESRFTMLGTIGEYAWERLQHSGEDATIRSAHAHYFLSLAQTLDTRMQGALDRHLMRLMDQEIDNVRAALSWARSDQDEALSLRLCAAMRRYWLVRGYLHEGRTWLESALRCVAEMTPTLRDQRREYSLWVAEAFYSAAVLAFAQSDTHQATNHYYSALAIYKSVEDPCGVARVFNGLGEVARQGGELRSAARFFAASVDLKRQEEDTAGIASTLNNLGLVHIAQGDFVAAAKLLNECLEISQALGDTQRVARALANLAEIERRTGDLVGARGHLHESLRLRTELGDVQGMGNALGNLGDVLFAQCDHVGALENYRQALVLFNQTGAQGGVACSLHAIARAACALGNYTEAAHILGAAEQLRVTLGMGNDPTEPMLGEHTEARLRSALGEHSFGAAYQRGRSLSLDQALELAQGEEETSEKHCLQLLRSVPALVARIQEPRTPL